MNIIGLNSLVGQRITLFCMNYIYTGKLVELDENQVRLDDAGIVYDTGPLLDKKWTDMQDLPHPVYIRMNSVESYMVLK